MTLYEHYHCDHQSERWCRQDTTAVNLAACLTALNQRVLLIDVDPQEVTTMGCGIDKHAA
ncbi:MAG: AAA family ATPase [Candidatus Competibacteraceae bacterium]